MYTVIFDKNAEKMFRKMDRNIQKIITKAVRNKLSVNPDLYLIPLVGDLSGLYKFRVGDYRLLCLKEDNRLIITVVKVKHRKIVYAE